MDFANTSTKARREFLAVILAGYGNGLLPLTNDHGGEPCPKALLPIANKPMISYAFSWVEDAGIRDVLLICPPSHRKAISHLVNSDPSSSSLSSLNIDIQTYDDQNQDIPADTCTILKHFAHRINCDFVLLPCDFFPPSSLKLTTLLNKFRMESITDGSLLTSLFYEHRIPEKDKNSEEGWEVVVPPAPVLYEEKNGTLLHIDSAEDDEELEIRMGVMWKYPKTKLSANLIDSHVYVCKRLVLDLIVAKSGSESFREEFIPWLCKVHTQKTKREKYDHVLRSIANAPTKTMSLALQHSTRHIPLSHSSHPKKISESGQSTPEENQTKTLHSNLSRKESLHFQDEKPSLRCGIIVHRSKDGGYAARADNCTSYLELNRINIANAGPSTLVPTLIDPRSSISADSIVGESSTIGERTSVKRSVIGKHCKISKNVKITGSVIMDHCVIADGVKIENSILGKNTTVGSKTELIRCVTQAGLEVEGGAVYKQEKLDFSDWTAGPTGNDDDDDDDEQAYSEGDSSEDD